jgi:hypothetical protein
MRLTEEQEAQVAALDIEIWNGGLSYEAFRALPGIVQDTFGRRQGAWQRAKQEAHDAAVSGWVKALTDDDVLAIIADIGHPFEIGGYTYSVSDAANKACGIARSKGDVPKNTGARLEKLAASGKIQRLKGDKASKRWAAEHTLVSGWNSNQWVYFTEAIAAEYDTKQAMGVAALADRHARFNLALAAAVMLNVKPTYTDYTSECRGTVTLSLEDFERLTAALTPSEQVAP